MWKHISGKKDYILLISIEALEETVRKEISQKRYEHTKRVLDTALIMAEKHGVNLEKTKIASLLHDYAKDLSPQELVRIIEKTGGLITPLELAEPELLHGPAGAILAQKKFSINDKNILESIKYHTIANRNLSDLAKIIYLADATEPFRQYPGVEKIRKLAETDLDQALLLSLNSTLEFLTKKGRLIHPNSIKARNDLIMKKQGVKLLNKTIDFVVEAIEEKKGTDISTIEFKDKGYIAEYFVIGTGNNNKMTKAIADFVEVELEKKGESVIRREGYQEGKWIILDYGYMMVHIFTPEEREYYNIERLWQESKKIMGMEKEDVQ